MQTPPTGETPPPVSPPEVPEPPTPKRLPTDKWWFWVIVAAIVLGGILAFGNAGDDTAQAASASPVAVSSPSPSYSPSPDPEPCIDTDRVKHAYNSAVANLNNAQRFTSFFTLKQAARYVDAAASDYQTVAALTDGFPTAGLATSVAKHLHRSATLLRSYHIEAATEQVQIAKPFIVLVMKDVKGILRGQNAC